MDSYLAKKDHFRDKPECVIDLPPWLLPAQKMDEYRQLPRLAIVEMAGRDSVAAAIVAVQTKGFTDLLPLYAYTGTEYGPWTSVETAGDRLRQRLPQTHVHDLLVLGSPHFWQALNGRFIGELIRQYGFYTPCVGCHLYLHAVRLPLALTLKAPVIAGERETHDGAVKVNQTATALNCYLDLATHFDVSLLFPLRYMDDGKEIETILGFDWKQGDEQLGCVLSGNYKNLGNRVNITEKRVQGYLREFAFPIALKTIETYGQNRIPDHRKLAFDVFQSMKAQRVLPQ
ncbi:MAG: hypothetical protein K9N10_11965 [Deltaproteobacteria bacterium]|nr:hypothetical protein [Deltaproteobacteria bacterium]